MDVLKKGFLKLFLTTITIFVCNTATAFEYEWTDNDPFLLDYVKNNREDIVRWATTSYGKGQKYRDYIETMAEKEGVPKELFALAGVESSFNPNAISQAGATGMWQFMKGTANDVGLRGNGKDSRKNWEKSTVAAIKYIKYLAEEHFYGDYELAVLAYNAGVGRVKKAILKNQSADVWVLIKDTKSFQKESRDYLPKFIAYANYYKYLDQQNKNY